MRKIIGFIGLFIAFTVIASCSSIDCPLNNQVFCKYKLQGDVTTLSDTLTISVSRSDGNDTVLLNKAVDVDSFEIPMSYSLEQDVLYFQVTSADTSLLDTVTLTKTNEPHFESVDCVASYFHTLNGVTYTQHSIDSIVINNSKVNYDRSNPNIYIYFKATD